MLASVLFCVLASAKTALGDWPFGANFVYWLWQSSVVVDQWLYIDGGEHYLAVEGGTPNPVYNGDTLAIDLSQSWTIDGIIVSSISKPPAMTAARRPALWYNPHSNRVMERGGWAYAADSSYLLWSFTPDGRGGANWALDQGSPAAQQISATFGSAFTASANTFYSLGGASPGALNTSTDPLNPYGFEALEGFVTYDFASSGWKNTSSMRASQTGYSVESQVISMPDFGKAGLLAFLGGESPTNQTFQYEVGTDIVDMSNITIYDVENDAWYYQTATGSVPPPRSEFCVVGSASADNSTYEIYVFGGSTNLTTDMANAKDPGYLDVYILSMPSFVWFKAGAGSEARRANHFCQVIGKRQMLVIGGRDPTHNVSTDLSFWPGGADPWTHGLGIFDMTTLSWSMTYDANATDYEQPAMVKQYYVDHVNTTNWSDPTLAVLFTPMSFPTTTTNTTSTTSPSPMPARTGAIVGGVVGGVVGLVLVAVIAFLLLHRRRRATGKGESAYEMQHEQKYEMESPAVEMPGGNVHVSEQKIASPHAYELDVQNDSKDQTFKQKPVSDA